MESWVEDDFQALLNITDANALFNRLCEVAKGLGFDYCAYGIRIPLPVSNPKVRMFSNYPVDWQQRYQECNYIAVDPTVEHGTRSTLPIVWTDALFERTPEFWEEARAQNLNIGWAQSSRGVQGTSGLLTLARSHDALDAKELRFKAERMNWLTQIAHTGMSNCIVPEMVPESKAALTPREIEVLKWSAEGKTCFEIAAILNISERTANFHVSNAVAKLGASNKIHATIKAAILQLF